MKDTQTVKNRAETATQCDHNRSRSRQRLKAEHEARKPPPEVNPETLPLTAITSEPGAFQMRDGQAIVQEWVGDLLKLLRGGVKRLDPILVWWTGARWVVLDGHHRLEAYRRHSEGKDNYPPVTVTVSRAVDPDRAILEANRENGKVKLNTTPRERSNQAWWLTVESIGSKAAVARASGVNVSTVSRMRKALEILEGKGWSPENLINAGWEYASAASKEQPDVILDEDYEPDARIWLQGREMAERLGKTFGPALKDNPDAAAVMLLSYGEETTKRILQSRFLHDVLREIEEEAEESVEY